MGLQPMSIMRDGLRWGQGDRVILQTVTYVGGDRRHAKAERGILRGTRRQLWFEASRAFKKIPDLMYTVDDIASIQLQDASLWRPTTIMVRCKDGSVVVFEHKKSASFIIGELSSSGLGALVSF
jgi:hypothetical protein